MYGITNASKMQSGESLIYAHNGETAGFIEGEKGFIARKFKEETYSQISSYYQDYIFGFYGNKYVKSGYNNNYEVLQYGGTSFAGGDVTAVNLGNQCCMYIDGALWGYNSIACNQCRYDTAPVGYPSANSITSSYTFYIGDGLALCRETDSGNMSLARVDYASKSIKETLYVFTENPSPSIANCYGIKIGSKLLICNITNGNYVCKYWLYDISSLEAPALLYASGNVPYNIRYAAGLNEGGILFACTNKSECFKAGGNEWLLLTVDAGNNIIPFEAPDNISAFLSNCSCLYNPANDIVTFGTADSFYAFVVDNGAFTPVSIDLGDVAAPYNGVYRLALSNDLSYAAINYRYASNYDETMVCALANSDGKLYAYKNMAENKGHVTGFATGKTVGGKLEFNGYLPKLSLAISVTPEPDSFKIIGDAE